MVDHEGGREQPEIGRPDHNTPRAGPLQLPLFSCTKMQNIFIKHMTLPPNRLCTHISDTSIGENMASKLSYNPLSVERCEIHLLKLLPPGAGPSPANSVLVNCTLELFSLNDNPHYQALSYMSRATRL